MNKKLSKKTTELGIFVLGIGILVATLILYFRSMSDAVSNPVFAIALSIGIVLTILGTLTLIFRKKALIIVSMIAVICCASVELFFSGQLIALAFSAGFPNNPQVKNVAVAVPFGRFMFTTILMAMVYRTGRQALDETTSFDSSVTQELDASDKAL